MVNQFTKSNLRVGHLHHPTREFPQRIQVEGVEGLDMDGCLTPVGPLGVSSICDRKIGKAKVSAAQIGIRESETKVCVS